MANGPPRRCRVPVPPVRMVHPFVPVLQRVNIGAVLESTGLPDSLRGHVGSPRRMTRADCPGNRNPPRHLGRGEGFRIRERPTQLQPSRKSRKISVPGRLSQEVRSGGEEESRSLSLDPALWTDRPPSAAKPRESFLRLHKKGRGFGWIRKGAERAVSPYGATQVSSRRTHGHFPVPRTRVQPATL